MSRPGEVVIVKKIKKAAHGHHGGAWKIAYADFVTAMMAFFLLLWLINMTTPEQKKGLADYFAPPNVTESTSGAGGVMAGQSIDVAGAQMTMDANQGLTTDGVGQYADAATAAISREDLGQGEEALRSSQEDLFSRDQQVFHAAAASIRQAWQALPEIAEIADNIIIEETDEGLDIQIVDQEGRPMFQEGSKYPYEWMRGAISALAPILDRLPNQIRISGHTAAGAHYADPRYGAWELSSDRANVVRSLLGEFGLSDDRIHSVVGRATSEPYFVNDPYLAANERIRITVLNSPPPVPLDLHP